MRFLTLPPKWVIKYGPGIVFGLKVIQCGLAIGRCAGLPLPIPPGGKELKSLLDTVIAFQQKLSAELGCQDNGFVETTICLMEHMMDDPPMTRIGKARTMML